MMQNKSTELKLRGQTIRLDENGMACLDDIWTAGGFTKNLKPHHWYQLAASHRYITSAFKQATGKSRNWSKNEMKCVFHTKKGIGTFANTYVALEYARFLNPALALEINEVFLRFKSGDPTLADETLQRATPEDNEWVAKRAMGRVTRNQYTRELDKRGVVKGFHFAHCTNETYKGLFDKTAKELKADKGLKPQAKLRDAMSIKEIVFTAAAEELAKERMEEEGAQGYPQCRQATAKSAKALRRAIEDDRRDRQPRLN